MVEAAGQPVRCGEEGHHTQSAGLVYPDLAQPGKTFLTLLRSVPHAEHACASSDSPTSQTGHRNTPQKCNGDNAHEGVPGAAVLVTETNFHFDVGSIH